MCPLQSLRAPPKGINSPILHLPSDESRVSPTRSQWGITSLCTTMTRTGMLWGTMVYAQAFPASGSLGVPPPLASMVESPDPDSPSSNA